MTLSHSRPACRKCAVHSLLAGLLVTLVTVAASAQQAPRSDGVLQEVAAFAWLGSWQALRSPSVPAPPDTGTAGGNLESVFEVKWTRTEDILRVRVTRTSEEWCGRLGVQLRVSPDVSALTYAHHDLPVKVPLSNVRPGPAFWLWTVGVPRWVVAHAPGAMACVLLQTDTHHGFFVNRQKEGGTTAQLCLDAGSVGDSAELALRLMPGANPEAMQAAAHRHYAIRPDPVVDRQAADALRAGGFVRADAAGVGFETAAGEPFYAVGQNQAHIITLSRAEQEDALKQAAAAGMTAIRILLPDWCYRPVPGVYNDGAFERLRECIDRCAAHGLRVIVCLEYGAHGYQYNAAIHLSRSPGDLYLMPQALAWYRQMVDRVVRPLRDDPAILAWDVTNEPDIAPDSTSPVLRGVFIDWLQGEYRTLEALRAQWGPETPDAFADVVVPDKDAYSNQSTPAARDFFRFAGHAVADAMIARARIIKGIDPNHMVTISHWNPRLLRGHEGAELFDFWAPHTYDLWVNGPAISHHVLYLVAGQRDALPDRRRPVVIEEFGLSKGSKYPDEMRSEHIAQFLGAGKRWGAGGVMHWWEMSRGMYDTYRDSRPYAAAPPEDAPTLAVYLPERQEWQAMLYPRYMTRRLWAKAMASAAEAGWRLRLLWDAQHVTDCAALLVLDDAPSSAEEAIAQALGKTVVLLPGVEPPAESLPTAVALPADWDRQVRWWAALKESAGQAPKGPEKPGR